MAGSTHGNGEHCPELGVGLEKMFGSYVTYPWMEGAGLVPWLGGPLDASFGFYVREAFYIQSKTEKILYNKGC